MVQITRDDAYNTVAPDDFRAMLDPDRYNIRSSAFDRIIAATKDHFRNPLDKCYIDFDMTADTIMPCEVFPIFHIAIGEAMNETKKQRDVALAIIIALA